MKNITKNEISRLKKLGRAVYIHQRKNIAVVDGFKYYQIVKEKWFDESECITPYNPMYDEIYY